MRGLLARHIGTGASLSRLSALPPQGLTTYHKCARTHTRVFWRTLFSRPTREESSGRTADAAVQEKQANAPGIPSEATKTGTTA